MTTAPPLSDDAISTPAPPPAPSLAQTTVPTPVAPSRRIVIIAWIALIIAVLSWSVMGPSFVFLNRKNVFPILAVVWRNSCVLLFTLLPALYQVISATPEQRRSWFARQPLSKTEEDTDLECVADAAAFVARARIQTQTQAQQEALAATAAAPVHGDDDEEEGAVYIMPMSPRHAAPTPAAAGLHGAAFARAGTPARVSTPARVGAPSRAAVYSPTPSPVLATREVGAAAAAVAAGSGSGASAGDAEAASPRPPVTLLTRSASTASVASSTAESVSHRGPMSPTTAGVAAAVGAARLRGPTPPPSPFSPMSPTGTAAGARALMPSPSSDSGSAPMTGQAALAVPVKVTVPVYERLPPGYAYTIPACAPVPAAAAAAAAGLTVGSGGFMQLGDALEPSDAPSSAAGDASGVGSAADVSALSSTDATAVMGGSSPSFAPANTTTTTTVTVSMPVLVPAPIPVQGSEIELVLELPPGDVTTTTDAPTAGASAGALEGVEYNVVTATLEPVPVPNKDASAIITAHFAAAVAANVNAQRAAARAGFPATSSEPVETVDQPCPAPAPPLGTVPFSAGACEWAEATDDALVTHFSAITAAISGLVVAVTAPVLSACGSACAASRVPAAARSCDRGWARAAGALRSAMPASWDWVWQAAGCDAFSRAGVAAGAAEGRGEYEDVGDIEMGAMGGSRPAAPMGPSMSRAQSDVSVANGADQGSLAALGSRETDSAAAVPADGPVKKTLSQHWNEAMERPMFVCVITGILWGMNVSTWVTALRFVTTVIASLLGSMSPVFIICYYLATAAPISRGELGGTAAAVAGVIACLGSSMFSGEETRDVENNSMAASGPIYALFGGLLALTCSACVAIDTVITARARKHVPIFVWIITSLFVSTVFCALLTLAIENTSVFGLGRTSIMGFLDPSILPTVMFLGFIGGLVGLVGYKFSIAYISPLVHTVTQLMDPMLTGIISYYLGYESAPTWPVYVGGSIIVLGIAGLVVGEFYRAQKNRRFVRALRAYAEGEAELVMAAAVGEGGCCGSVAMVGEKGVVEVQVNGKAFY